MRRCWWREEVQECKARVPRSRGPTVPGSQGPKFLKLRFKYELDSKEGPSCYKTKFAPMISKRASFGKMNKLILLIIFPGVVSS